MQWKRLRNQGRVCKEIFIRASFEGPRNLPLAQVSHGLDSLPLFCAPLQTCLAICRRLVLRSPAATKIHRCSIFPSISNSMLVEATGAGQLYRIFGVENIPAVFLPVIFLNPLIYHILSLSHLLSFIISAVSFISEFFSFFFNLKLCSILEYSNYVSTCILNGYILLSAA